MSQKTSKKEVASDLEDGIRFFCGSTEENGHSIRFQHQQSIFSPGPMAQKLTQAKDYVESLHQNDRAPLLYGKNNVMVQPVSKRQEFPGSNQTNQSILIMTKHKYFFTELRRMWLIKR